MEKVLPFWRRKRAPGLALRMWLFLNNKSNLVLYSSYKPTKILTRRLVKSTLQQLWCCSHGVTIKKVGNNLFLAIFAKKEKWRTWLKFKIESLDLLVKDLFYWSVSMVISTLIMLFSNVLLSGFGFLTFLLKLWT